MKQHQQSDVVMAVLRDLDQRVGAEIAQVLASSESRCRTYHKVASESLQCLEEKLNEKITRMTAEQTRTNETQRTLGQTVDNLEKSLTNKIAQASLDHSQLQSEHLQVCQRAVQSVQSKVTDEVGQCVNEIHLLMRQGDEKHERNAQAMSIRITEVQDRLAQVDLCCSTLTGQIRDASDCCSTLTGQLRDASEELHDCLSELSRRGDEKLEECRKALSGRIDGIADEASKEALVVAHQGSKKIDEFENTLDEKVGEVGRRMAETLHSCKEEVRGHKAFVDNCLLQKGADVDHRITEMGKKSVTELEKSRDAVGQVIQ